MPNYDTYLAIGTEHHDEAVLDGDVYDPDLHAVLLEEAAEQWADSIRDGGI